MVSELEWLRGRRLLIPLCGQRVFQTPTRRGIGTEFKLSPCVMEAAEIFLFQLPTLHGLFQVHKRERRRLRSMQAVQESLPLSLSW